MKEANIFEAWADRLTEGTWSTPDTPEKRAQLAMLMSKEFPVGADATDATEQLYDLLGDDELFDQLQTLAMTDANADARQIILDRMQELSQDPDIRAAMAEFNTDVDSPAEPTQEAVEDPADTAQPEYDEYDDSLKKILQRAGVDDTVKAAPPYEASVEEDAQPGVVDDFDEAENLSPFTEGQCNMTEAGESCPMHGLDECGMEESQDMTSTAKGSLQGQYGHSGKMKEVSKNSSVLDRLKELSGMMRSDKI
jgi:hypothetical protein